MPVSEAARILKHLKKALIVFYSYSVLKPFDVNARVRH